MAAFSSTLFGASPRAEYFPLEKGNYWIYRGKAEFLVPKENATEKEREAGTANEAKSEVLTWKMEVIDTLERPNVFAALIKGGPWDLAWYKPGKARGDYVILRVGEFRYYQYSEESAKSVWMKLLDSPSDAMPLKIPEGELMLDFPLAVGKVFGGDFPAYLRSRYCWVVEGERSVKRPSGKTPKRVEYALSFRTTPDHQLMTFQTGVGISGFTYGHHGTLSGVELELIEFGGNKSQKEKANDRSR